MRKTAVNTTYTFAANAKGSSSEFQHGRTSGTRYFSYVLRDGSITEHFLSGVQFVGPIEEKPDFKEAVAFNRGLLEITPDEFWHEGGWTPIPDPVTYYCTRKP